MNIDVWSMLILAFGLGMLHALDADHIIAVSGLSCQQPGRKTGLAYCGRWALGHGGVLLVFGTAVLFMGMAIPESMSAVAENAVGFVLIAIGLLVLRELYRQGAHLHFHRHDGLPDHAHWHRHKHSKQDHKADQHQHNHTPIFVGMLHGMAGTAPLLALLPLSQMSPWIGIMYLLLFGTGVFVAMVIFGGVLGRVFDLMQAWGNHFVSILRVAVSFLSIAYGLKLIVVMH